MTVTNALALVVAFCRLGAADGQFSGSLVRINEVADKGSSDVCDGEDWIELHLPKSDDAPEDLDISNYVLHDDGGPLDDKAFTFPVGTLLSPDQYLLLCVGAEGAPRFGIGKTDQVTLRDSVGAVASTTGPLGGRGALDTTVAFDGAAYVYTTTPTPGAANVITAPPDPETAEERRARLIARNALGTAFFNMDGDGAAVDGGLPDVVDLRIEMNATAVDKLRAEQSYGMYHPFAAAAVTVRDDPEDVLLALSAGGRLRPKGQSTLSLGTCMDRSIPYSVDFDRGADPDQTLFGVGRAYLRTHMGDPSHAREWTAHRMLARFGLPHLRTRTVRLFFNGEYEGLYDIVEAPDQDYVHQRSFPSFDPAEYGLYKIKTLSIGCGSATFDDALADAEPRLGETDTPPYIFERGEHRPMIPVLKDYTKCFIDFFTGIDSEFQDVALAYLRKNATCGEFLVDQGLIDRDLGANKVDTQMAAFVNSHLAGSQCDPGCANSDLADDVDVDNFLRNIAVLAAVLHQDSPIGNGNNYYLARSTADGKWSMVQYDHNNIMSADTSESLCSPQCKDNYIKWSILRPTCGALEGSQMAGPLLADATLRARYVEHVREFLADVMTNEAFLDQIHAHLVAVREDAMTDSWNDAAALFDLELAEGNEWKHVIYGQTYTPFLPTLRARAAEVEKQLAAIEDGTFARDLADIGEDEVCVDWDADGPRESVCGGGCSYEGCVMPGLTVPAFCDPVSNRCMHGTSDSKCVGVANTEGYDGIESFEGSSELPFCWSEPSGSMKLAFCPPKGGHDGGSLTCGDLTLISSAAAGSSCNGGTLDGKNSNEGTTEAQCIDGGGSYNPYTCGDIENYFENDPEAKALGDDVVNYLMEEWYRPTCCKTNGDEDSVCGDLALISSAAAGSSCNGGTLEGKDSNEGITEAQCIDGGSSYNPYTCGDMVNYFENDPRAKALGDDVVNYLMEEWYKVKCCESNFKDTPGLETTAEAEETKDGSLETTAEKEGTKDVSPETVAENDGTNDGTNLIDVEKTENNDAGDKEKGNGDTTDEDSDGGSNEEVSGTKKEINAGARILFPFASTVHLFVTMVLSVIAVIV